METAEFVEMVEKVEMLLYSELGAAGVPFGEARKISDKLITTLNQGCCLQGQPPCTCKPY